jgi:hypothetical protein
MNRAKSITDIGDIYRAMQQKNIQQMNESVISEAAKVKAKFPKDTFKKSEESTKEPSTFKKGGPKNVKGLMKPKKNKKFSQKSKKIVKEDINSFMSIFDKLYEDVMKNDELDINTGIGMGPEGSAGDDDLGMDSEMDSSSDSDEVTITMSKSVAQELMDLLQAAVGDSSDESDSDLEDLGVDTDSDDSEDEDYEEEAEDMQHETIDIDKLPDSSGHKLQKGMEAAGNIKATTGKADASATDKVGNETGKHPMDHKSELCNPSKNKVGTLKTGKSLFDQ